ncbi:hypothetical protein GN244_ATG17151 [Phytophthora infestans]|uniref:Uncharacterized protein n=1 Tax=Phytophthora infestans TaxID=4787 RepID=A0A833WEN8_PHYIN|nr:hypothetical protein GN244_ATG17151 [Phytophthora infestans]
MTRASGKRKRAPGDAGSIGGLRNLAKRSRSSPTKRNDPIVSPHDLDVPGVLATGTIQTTMFSLPDTSDGGSIQYAPDAVSGSSRIVPMDRAITSLSKVVSAWSGTSSVASTLDLRLHGSDSEESSVGQASSYPSRLRLQPTRKAKKNGRLDQSADSDFSISQASSAFDVVPGSTRHHSGHDSDSTFSSTCSSPGFEQLGLHMWSVSTATSHQPTSNMPQCQQVGCVTAGSFAMFRPAKMRSTIAFATVEIALTRRYGIDAREAGGLFRLANHASNGCREGHTSVSQERDPVGSSPASKEKNVVSQLAQCSQQSQSPIPEAQYSGIAITSSGTFDASLAAALDLSDSDEDEEKREKKNLAPTMWMAITSVTFKRVQTTRLLGLTNTVKLALERCHRIPTQTPPFGLKESLK